MVNSPLPDQCIDQYAGPYERWVFSQNLGRPFAFPAISDGTATHFTAILEGTDMLPNDAAMETRLPPLWNPLNKTRSVTPFAFHKIEGTKAGPAMPVETDILSMMETLCASQTGDVIQPRYRINFPVNPGAWTKGYQTGPGNAGWQKPKTKPKAIIAVIDDGIPFAHSAFLDSHGETRMSHVWLQSAQAEDGAFVPFGRELKNARINTLRAEAGTNEDLIYRNAGAIHPDMPEMSHYMRRHATHGSHVSGMCAGNDSRLSSHPIGDDVQIIAVQLPNTIAWDTSGFGKEMYMLSALHYVFDRARAIAAEYTAVGQDIQELPLIVNFSYGWLASRHDGQSEMELAIQELLEDRIPMQPKTAIVMPTGNDFHSEVHGQITSLVSGGEFPFGWHVLPDDRTSSYLEVWLPENFDPAGYTVHVQPPEGYSLSAGGEIDFTEDMALNADAHSSGDPRRFTEIEIGGEIIGQLSVDLHRGTRWRAMLAIIPTVFMRGENRAAPSGVWKIKISNKSGVDLGADDQINVWVQRDDDPASLQTGGRQSYLVDLAPPEASNNGPLQDYDKRFGFVRGYGAINGVASSASVTRVAAHVASTKRPTYYSGSHGLVKQADGSVLPWGAQTNLTAVGDQSLMLPGTLSIGVRSGASVRLSGTSGATPAVSRQMVINAASGKELLDSMDPVLPMYRTEEVHAVTKAKHSARVGASTMRLVGKKKPAFA